MANIDLTDQAVRRSIIEEITVNEDNLSRKREAQKRFDVYRDRQDRYITEKLREEFSNKTVDEMRKVLSINISKKIIDEQASIFNSEPERLFTDASEKEIEQLENIYRINKINSSLSTSNKYFKLFKQSALMVVPQDGKISVRALGPMWYDVIPDDSNPENAFAYIMNVWDFDTNKTIRQVTDNATERYFNNDHINQQIADDNDRKALLQRFKVWTATDHFTMNGKGQIMGGVEPNPIGRLPFIDIAVEKDFQFFVRRGQNVTEFSIDFGVQLSDLANTARLQAYAQAIVTAVKQPTNMVVGPNHVIFLQMDPNRPELNPRFEFVSPNPDLSGALEILETQLKFLLSSEGLDTSLVTGKGDSRQFASGMDRLLAMLDKFEATKADTDIFRCVELELFDLIRLWSNVMQGVTDESQLDESLRIANIGDQVKLDVVFKEPVALQTDKDIQESVFARLDKGLMTKVTAIQKLDKVDEDAAIEILEKIDKEDDLMKIPEPGMDALATDGSTGHTHLLDDKEIPVDNVALGAPHDHSGSVKSAPNDPGHAHDTLDGSGQSGPFIKVDDGSAEG